MSEPRPSSSSPSRNDGSDGVSQHSPSSPPPLGFADLRSRFEKLAKPSSSSSSPPSTPRNISRQGHSHDHSHSHSNSLPAASGSPGRHGLHIPHAVTELGIRLRHISDRDASRADEGQITPSSPGSGGSAQQETRPSSGSSRGPPPPRPPKPSMPQPSAEASSSSQGIAQLRASFQAQDTASPLRRSSPAGLSSTAPPRVDARVPPPPPPPSAPLETQTRSRDASLSSLSDVTAALQWANDPTTKEEPAVNGASAIPIPPPLPRRASPNTILSPPAVLSPDAAAEPHSLPAERGHRPLPPLPVPPPPALGLTTTGARTVPSTPGSLPSATPTRQDGARSAPLPPPLRTAVKRPQQPSSSSMARSTSNSSAPGGDSSSSESEDDMETPVAVAAPSLPNSSSSTAASSLAAQAQAALIADTLPDASRANRRPPSLDPRRQATLKHFTCAAVSGHTICLASGDKVRVYRVGSTALQGSDKLCSLVAEKGGKEVKITTMAFRPDEVDEGRYLWCGTKEGQIWEMDIAHALVVGVRQSVHTAAIVVMERLGPDLLTMDESGKICIWSGKPLSLTSQPVSQRITLEKGSVVLALGHQLWVCAGGGGGGPGASGVGSPPMMAVSAGIQSASAAVAAAAGSHGSHHRASSHSPSPLRIKILNPTSLTMPFHATSRPIGLGDVVRGSGAVGAITCGTLLQSDPTRAYLGHDSGHVSVWDRKKMVCVAVQRLSTLGFTALCGVGDFLWAGNRSGRITIYQPSYLEGQHWQVIKSWPAHKHGVSAIWVDTTALHDVDVPALPVASAGVGHRVEIWDGTLAHDYIAHRLSKRVSEYSTYRRLRSLHITFNIDAAPASALNTSATAMDWLPQVFASAGQPPDLIYIGFQEVVDLEDKSLTAKSMLLNATKGKSRAKAQLNERISHQYREWQSRLIQSIRLAMPPDCPYTLVHTEPLVGLLTCVFVRSAESKAVSDVALSTVKCGLGGRWGNKGAILSRIVIDDTSCCFINAHLAAGQKHVKQRNADVAQVMEAEALPPGTSDDAVYVGGGDGQLVLDHELVFLGGDLNYRIDLPRSQVLAAIERRDWSSLIERDQLTLELRKNAPTFRLRGFHEASALEWGPTYKFDRNSTGYDSSEKKRVPAWCDRLLYRDALAGDGTDGDEVAASRERITCLDYRSWPELTISDHRPVSSVYEFQVKRVDRQKREVVRREEEARGESRLRDLLEQARSFYADVAAP